MVRARVKGPRIETLCLTLVGTSESTLDSYPPSPLAEAFKEVSRKVFFSKDHVENYRPISLLLIASKVFERCVLNSIKDHLYQVISPKQHGFCTGRSCVTNLLEALDHIGSLLDSGSQVGTIYLDMSKAFDKVSHRGLVHKLIQAGFSGNLLNWFFSYLSSRRQRVTVLGATSEDLPVTSGVPQGSILEPVLFLLYVNELPEVISSSSRILMFADDTKIFGEIKTLGDASSLQEDLGKLATWSQLSGLLFNEVSERRSTLQGKQSRSYPLTNSTTPHLNYMRQEKIWAFGLVRI